MSWATEKLGDIAEFSNGLNFDKTAYGEGIHIIGVSDFTNNFYPCYDTLSQIKEEYVNEKSLLEDGDIGKSFKKYG
ncbi:hypothetical protein [Roseburia sp. MSJ-14]|uniref:hypothetical protein n=1 Tax=Roseburia sp. MSJ-14 TaxID=2841514 RepID=UPI001C11F280|nr:hypothetical protein [Roseburia sp. MSJ-14]MBU5473379.1 hypothetical protein [Roseburia sp. MSJ-14]